MNRYKYEYACEDEYFHRELTIYDAKKMRFPNYIEVKERPMNEIKPAHHNDVRFNYLPQYLDRRNPLPEQYAKQYDFCHGDFQHGFGLPDEDHDGELPDPISMQHFVTARSGIMAWIWGAIAICLMYGYPVFGLKMPQRDNPYWWRKKFGTATSIQ